MFVASFVFTTFLIAFAFSTLQYVILTHSHPPQRLGIEKLINFKLLLRAFILAFWGRKYWLNELWYGINSNVRNEKRSHSGNETRRVVFFLVEVPCADWCMWEWVRYIAAAFYCGVMEMLIAWESQSQDRRLSLHSTSIRTYGIHLSGGAKTKLTDHFTCKSMRMLFPFCVAQNILPFHQNLICQ